MLKLIVNIIQSYSWNHACNQACVAVYFFSCAFSFLQIFRYYLKSTFSWGIIKFSTIVWNENITFCFVYAFTMLSCPLKVFEGIFCFSLFLFLYDTMYFTLSTSLLVNGAFTVGIFLFNGIENYCAFHIHAKCDNLLCKLDWHFDAELCGMQTHVRGSFSLFPVVFCVEYQDVACSFEVCGLA